MKNDVAKFNRFIKYFIHPNKTAFINPQNRGQNITILYNIPFFMVILSFHYTILLGHCMLSQNHCHCTGQFHRFHDGEHLFSIQISIPAKTMISRISNFFSILYCFLDWTSF